MVAAVVVPRRFYPQQHDFLHDARKWVCFVGGRGSGKTYAGSWKALARACRPNAGVGVIAAPNFPMLEFGAKRQFIARLREADIHFEQNRSTGVLTIPRTGAEVRFATLDNESRIRGPNYAWGWVDELDYLADTEIWQALKGAIRDGAQPQLFATSTPKGRRLMWREWVEGATADHALYRASTLDNLYIDAKGYVDALGYDGRYYRQEIEAGFEGAEGLVYEAWSRERVCEADTNGWRHVLGVDVGTRNPTAILDVAVAGTGRQHIAAEIYRRNMAASEVVAAIRAAFERAGAEAIVIDPSAAGYVRDLELLGYPVVKADNDRKRGVQLCTTALAGGLTVEPSCENFIAEIESYHYPDGGHGDDPVKEMDHALDAWRYVTVYVAEPEPEVMFWA